MSGTGVPGPPEPAGTFSISEKNSMLGMTQSAICRGSMRRDVRLTAFSGRGSLPLGPGPPVGGRRPPARIPPVISARGTASGGGMGGYL